MREGSQLGFMRARPPVTGEKSKHNFSTKTDVKKPPLFELLENEKFSQNI